MVCLGDIFYISSIPTFPRDSAFVALCFFKYKFDMVQAPDKPTDIG